MIVWWVLALISALFSGTASILEKNALFREKALSFSTLFAVFNLFLAIPFFFFINYSELTSLGILVVLIKSILESVAFLCVMKGIKSMELSSALPLLVLTPGLVAVFAFIFLKESLSSLEISGMALLLIGTYFLQLRGNQKIFDSFKSLFKSKGYIYIIIALVTFTVTSILDKAILKNFNVPVNAFMGFQHLFLAIIFLSLIFLTKERTEIKQTFKRTGKLIFLISIITIIYRYSQLQAVKATQVALALSIKRLSVFFAVTIGGRIFREKNLIKKIIATAIMTIGAILIIHG
ncbi:MAG: EamA family transporter [Candidatus Pacearchaeota archaeon]|nr:EamA family transporter [Candidatus Pacearchaeota archaeon]